MKTKEDIQKEINIVKSEFLELSETDQKRKKTNINSKIKFLKMCYNYLDCDNINESQVKKHYQACLYKQDIIIKRFDEWKKYLSSTEISKANGDLQSYYFKINDMTHLKKQIKTLEFILD